MSKELGKKLTDILDEQSQPPFKIVGDDSLEVASYVPEHLEVKPFSCVPYISNDLKQINKRNEGCF